MCVRQLAAQAKRDEVCIRQMLRDVKCVFDRCCGYREMKCVMLRLRRSEVC